MTKEIKIALLMAASLFMEILDGTIVTTALPGMAKYFHTEFCCYSITCKCLSNYSCCFHTFKWLDGKSLW